MFRLGFDREKLRDNLDSRPLCLCFDTVSKPIDE